MMGDYKITAKIVDKFDSSVPGFLSQYSYIDPMTGKAVYSDEPPMDILYDLISSLADQTITSRIEPWVRL